MFKLLRFILVCLLIPACNNQPDKKAPWHQHRPTFWVTTPNGHVRDGGPFASVAAGWLTEADIDAAVDDEFSKFAIAFPQLTAPNLSVTLNDDYTMWVGAWASGVEYSGRPDIGVCLWQRVVSITDPGPAWIVRPPGVYWGIDYAEWRHTGKPLCPAIAHELLHACIGDPDHTSPLWALCP